MFLSFVLETEQGVDSFRISQKSSVRPTMRSVHDARARDCLARISMGFRRRALVNTACSAESSEPATSCGVLPEWLWNGEGLLPCHGPAILNLLEWGGSTLPRSRCSVSEFTRSENVPKVGRGKHGPEVGACAHVTRRATASAK